MYFAWQLLPVLLAPGEAVIWFMLGAIAINIEFLWPGRYVPGAAGLALCCVALSTHPRATTGDLALGVLAIALFTMQARWRLHLIPGACATVLSGLAIGTQGLFTLPAVALAAAQGCLLTFSLAIACESRKTKRHGIKIVVDERHNSQHNRGKHPYE